MYKKILLFLNKHRAIVIILFLALILRLIYFCAITYNFGNDGFYLTSNGDALEYVRLAKQWLERHTFQSLLVYEPEVFRMPGFPLYIAFFYKFISSSTAFALAVLIQNIIFVFCIALFYRFVLDLFRNRTIALLASGFLALEPSVIYWNNQLITESLFSILIFLTIYSSFIFLKRKNLYYPALSGLFLALAIFVRPAGEYLATILIFFYFLIFLFKKISLKKLILGVLIFIIGFFVPLSPWIARNKDYFGKYSISNSSEIGFGKYLSAMKMRLGEPVEKISSPNIEIVYQNRKISYPNKMIKVEIVRKRIIKYIMAHPFIFAEIYTLSLVPFFFGDAYLSVVGRIFPDLEKQRVITDWSGGGTELLGFLRGHQGMEAVIFFSGKIIWSAITFFALLGLIYWIFRYKKQYPVLILLLLFIVYFSLASGIGSYSRFRFPVVFYIFLFSALGIYWTLNFKKLKRI